MSKLRPYLVTFRGETRLVEATGQGPAQNHVIKDEVAKVKAGIESCRAANGTDVAAFVRAGGTIETAGEGPAELGRVGRLLGSLIAEEPPMIVLGVTIFPGDVLVPLGPEGRYRKVEEGDDMTNAIVVPEKFEIDVATGFISWPQATNGSHGTIKSERDRIDAEGEAEEGAKK